MLARALFRWILQLSAFASVFAGVGSAFADDDSSVEAQLIRATGRMSLDLRKKRLSPEERKQVVAELNAGKDATAIYGGFVDRWTDKAALRTVFTRSAYAPPHGTAALYLRTLQRRTEPSGEETYFLASRLPKDRSAESPCAADERERVRPWWSKTPIDICKHSYRPDLVFVDGGKVSCDQSWRTECACGPSLMYCAPPPTPTLNFVHKLQQSITDEVVHTAVELANEGSFSRLYTTGRTWQDDFVRFIYLRREVTGLFFNREVTPDLLKTADQMFSDIDINAPARWVDRKKPYDQAGIYFTTPVYLYATYRDTIRRLFQRALCVSPESVSVDRDALITAVGENHANIRSLDDVTDSPMRHQTGCSGCHMPLDTTSGFLFETRTIAHGQLPTKKAPAAKFYLTGPNDYRGKGRGIRDLMRLVTEQPEFMTCAATNTFAALLQRPPANSERVLIEGWAKEFKRRDQDWPWLVREVLSSEQYRGSFASAPQSSR